MCAGASSREREVSAARSASLSGSGAKRPPSQSAGDGLGIHAALELEHAEHAGARRIGVHQPGARGAPPQHVPQQAGDRGAVAGAGIAVRGAPLLQRLRRGNALGVDGLDQFDGCGQPGSGSHSGLSVREGRVQISSRIFSAK